MKISRSGTRPLLEDPLPRPEVPPYVRVEELVAAKQEGEPPERGDQQGVKPAEYWLPGCQCRGWSSDPSRPAKKCLGPARAGYHPGS